MNVQGDVGLGGNLSAVLIRDGKPVRAYDLERGRVGRLLGTIVHYARRIGGCF